MSYDIGNLGLKSGDKKKTWLYVAIVVLIIVVVVAGTKLAGLW